MGIRCHPAAVSALTQEAVRFGWEQAMLAPPTYTPTARYGDAPQADMVDALGVAQGSKPRPVNTLPAWWGTSAARARGADAPDADEPRRDPDPRAPVERTPRARVMTPGWARQVAVTRTPWLGSASSPAEPWAGCAPGSLTPGSGVPDAAPARALPAAIGSIRIASLRPAACAGHC